MNHERLLKIADVIEAHPEKFSMTYFYAGKEFDRVIDEVHDWTCASEVAAHLDLYDEECGTTACIAGHACSLWAADLQPDDDYETGARRILGLDPSTAWHLFFGQITELNTPKKAATYLREMVADDLAK